MSNSYAQEILNKIIPLLTDFAKLDISSFDISEEKQLYLDSIGVLFNDIFKDGIAVRFNLYLYNPVHIIALVSRESVYEIAERMNIDIDTDFEKVRYNEETLSFIVEIVNLMTAAVADIYAKRINKRVIYSPPKIVRHIFSPNILKGIDIRGRMASITTYEFLFNRPDSGIKLFLIC